MRMITTLAMGLLLWLGLSSASHAASQTLIGTTYESYSDGRTCNSVNVCTISFLPLPAGRTYYIQRVRCRVMSDERPILLYFGPTVQDRSFGLLKETYFEEISSVYTGSFYHATYEAIPQMMIGAGRFPTVYFQSYNIISSITIVCSLAATTL